MRRMKKYTAHNPAEFELDLAPLLAVMVKLVPVLLISSAFVQIMTVDSQLPQAVQAAISEQKNEDTARISLEAKKNEGFILSVIRKGQAPQKTTVALKNGQFDFASLHQALVKIKSENPQVFSLDLAPDQDIAYKDVVKITDEARRSRDQKIRFPIVDKKTNQNTTTDYMFPDIVFTNIFEG